MLKITWIIFIFAVPLPCIVSDWTEWSSPDATGTSYRNRMVLRPPLNVDGECPPLLQSRKSKLLLNKIFTSLSKEFFLIFF